MGLLHPGSGDGRGSAVISGLVGQRQRFGSRIGALSQTAPIRTFGRFHNQNQALSGQATIWLRGEFGVDEAGCVMNPED